MGWEARPDGQVIPAATDEFAAVFTVSAYSEHHALQPDGYPGIG